MKLKGYYSALTSYAVGDAVVCDGRAYHLQKAAPAGTYPTDTRYWGPVNQNKAEQMIFLVEGMGSVSEEVAEVEAKIPDNISDDGILLNGTAEGSTGQYLITVDDTDPTDPELSVTAQAGGD